MTVDLDGSWRMQVSLSVCSPIVNSTLVVREVLRGKLLQVLHSLLGGCVHIYFCLCVSSGCVVFVFTQTRFGSCESRCVSSKWKSLTGGPRRLSSHGCLQLKYLPV